jgi:ribosome-binding protein aMBF1 (putative translation factor)
LSQQCLEPARLGDLDASMLVIHRELARLSQGGARRVAFETPGVRDGMTGKDRIGARVARLRKGRGLSQIGLARRAGVSHSLLSKVEAGRVPASPVFIDREIVHSGHQA